MPQKLLNLKINNETGKAELYLYGEIVGNDSFVSEYFPDDKAPSQIARELSALNDAHTLDIYFNSPGGDVWAGMAIANQLDRFGGTIKAHVDGLCASIASVIAMYSDELIVPKNAQLMIHNPTVSGYMSGGSNDLRSLADRLDATRGQCVDAYMRKCKKTKDDIENLMDAETWLYGNEVADVFEATIADEINIQNCYSPLLDTYKKRPEQAALEHERAKLKLIQEMYK